MTSYADHYAQRDREERARLEASATRVPAAEYKFEWVSTDPHGEEGCYLTVHDAIERGYEWAWGCERQPWPTFDAEGIVRAHTEDGYCEDAHDRFDTAALQTLIDGWLESHGESPFFVADPTVIVVLRGGAQ